MCVQVCLFSSFRFWVCFPATSCRCRDTPFPFVFQLLRGMRESVAAIPVLFCFRSFWETCASPQIAISPPSNFVAPLFGDSRRVCFLFIHHHLFFAFSVGEVPKRCADKHVHAHAHRCGQAHTYRHTRISRHRLFSLHVIHSSADLRTHVHMHAEIQ